MKKIGKMFIFVVAISLMAIPVSACAEAKLAESPDSIEMPATYDNEGQTVFVINEYEEYKNWLKSQNLSTFSNDDRYIQALKGLMQYSDEELKLMNYSQGTREISRKMKNNPAYIPTDEELTRAAATLRFTFACSDTYMRDTKTYFTYIWSYDWSSPPYFRGSDVICFHWQGDFYMDESLIDAEITYSREGQNIIVADFSDEMKSGIAPNKNLCNLEVPLEYETADKYDRCALSGEGEFTVRCDSHGHPDMKIEWAYGHRLLGVSGVDVTLGTSWPSITLGTCYDELASGNRTYIVN